MFLSMSSLCALSPLAAFSDGQDSGDDTATTETTKIVEMLNYHPTDDKKRMVFYPLITVVQPGESVLFKRVDGGHDSASIDGMIPEGAEPWRGKIGQDITVTFTRPGFYGYVCSPHATMGMVGLIVVEGPGKLDNLDAARAVQHRGRANRIWGEIWAQAEADGLLEPTAP